MIRLLKLLAAVICMNPLMLQAAETTLPAGQGLSPVYFVKLGFALILVLAMFVGFAWLMRRFNGYQSSAQGGLQVITGLNLGTREKLVVVQVGEEQLLLGVTPGKIARLHELESQIAMDQPASTGDFKQKLKTALGKKD